MAKEKIEEKVEVKMTLKKYASTDALAKGQPFEVREVVLVVDDKCRT